MCCRPRPCKGGDGFWHRGRVRSCVRPRMRPVRLRALMRFAVRLPISSARSGRGSLNGFCRSPGSTGCHHATFALARPPAAATSGGKLFLPCCGGLAPNGRVAGPAAGRQRPDDACRRVGLRDGRDHRRAALEQASLPAPWSFCGGSADGPGKCSRQATPRQRDAANCGRGCACSSDVQPAGGTSVFTLTSYHSA